MRDKIKVKFNNVSDVSKFVRIVSQYDGDFDLYCGSYCVDAKSILGIMTLDLKSILWMTSNCEQSDKEKLIRELKPVICAQLLKEEMCGYKHFGHYILLIVMPVFGIMF